jgi:hypothetical protein
MLETLVLVGSLAVNVWLVLDHFHLTSKLKAGAETAVKDVEKAVTDVVDEVKKVL